MPSETGITHTMHTLNLKFALS